MTKLPSLSGKKVLITGASSGIGEALAEVFGQASNDLILVARDSRRLEAMARILSERHHIRVVAIAKDLTFSAAVRELHGEAVTVFGKVDILINNAGMGTYGFFSTLDLEKELALLRLNMEAVVHLSRLFLPEMIERGEGAILNVASTTAFLPGPFMASYFASKAFVLSFSEALAEELQGTGVFVSTLCPGPTQTDFQKRMGRDHLKVFRGKRVMTALEVAKAGYQALCRRKRVVVCGKGNQVVVLFMRFLPHRLLTWLVSRLQRKRQIIPQKGS